MVLVVRAQKLNCCFCCVKPTFLTVAFGAGCVQNTNLIFVLSNAPLKPLMSLAVNLKRTLSGDLFLFLMR